MVAWIYHKRASYSHWIKSSHLFCSVFAACYSLPAHHCYIYHLPSVLCFTFRCLVAVAWGHTGWLTGPVRGLLESCLFQDRPVIPVFLFPYLGACFFLSPLHPRRSLPEDNFSEFPVCFRLAARPAFRFFRLCTRSSNVFPVPLCRHFLFARNLPLIYDNFTLSLPIATAFSIRYGLRNSVVPKALTASLSLAISQATSAQVRSRDRSSCLHEGERVNVKRRCVKRENENEHAGSNEQSNGNRQNTCKKRSNR